MTEYLVLQMLLGLKVKVRVKALEKLLVQVLVNNNDSCLLYLTTFSQGSIISKGLVENKNMKGAEEGSKANTRPI